MIQMREAKQKKHETEEERNAHKTFKTRNSETDHKKTTPNAVKRRKSILYEQMIAGIEKCKCCKSKSASKLLCAYTPTIIN